MNKQRYLAELQRLLVFMTEEDRTQTIRRYGELFDAAGPEGETELIRQIGSPTKAAIGLSRGYEPGNPALPLPQAPAEAVSDKEPEAEPEAAHPDADEDPFGEMPSFELPDYMSLPDEGDEQGERRFSMPDLPAYTGADEHGGSADAQRSIPLGLGIALFVLVILGLGVPLAAVAAGLCAALLVPGCGVFAGAYLFFVGGLWCLSYIADAILLFGGAFVVLALGIILFFAGLWLDGKLIALYIRGLRWVAGELFGRRTANE